VVGPAAYEAGLLQPIQGAGDRGLADVHRLSQAARIFDVPDAELQGQAVQELDDRTAL
jgi:hypothetical protein